MERLRFNGNSTEKESTEGQNARLLFFESREHMHYKHRACGVGARDIKGTGTRDLIWPKVVSLDRSWLVGLTDDL